MPSTWAAGPAATPCSWPPRGTGSTPSTCHRPPSAGPANAPARPAPRSASTWATPSPPTRPSLTGPYDLIHDSGCFHHLPPHRRVSYLALLGRLLAPGGHLVLTCFAAGEEGSGTSAPDAELYRHPERLRGGLGYTAGQLRWIFSGLEEVELRRMDQEPEDSPYFGVPFLWNGLFRRPSA